MRSKRLKAKRRARMADRQRRLRALRLRLAVTMEALRLVREVRLNNGIPYDGTERVWTDRGPVDVTAGTHALARLAQGEPERPLLALNDPEYLKLHMVTELVYFTRFTCAECHLSRRAMSLEDLPQHICLQLHLDAAALARRILIGQSSIPTC